MPSNLTFGSGGKNKDGNSIPGWGYYEVRFILFICKFCHRLKLDPRQSRAALAQDLIGMVQTVYTPTSQIHGSGMWKFLSDDIQ